MSRLGARLTLGNVLAIVGVFVALAGGAYAAVKSYGDIRNPYVSRSGTIQGCVKHGALDVVKAGKHCRKGSISLPFNQKAQQASQGSAGAGYFVYGAAAGVSLSSKVASPVAVVAKSNVPAGIYVITAKVNLTASDAHPGTSSEVNCQLVDTPASGTPVGDSDFWTPITNALVSSTYEDQTTLPLALDLTTTSTSTVSLTCDDVSNNNTTASFALSASNAEISAVQVSSLR